MTQNPASTVSRSKMSERPAGRTGASRVSACLFGAFMALLRAQSECLVQRVNLHLALGGSFDNSRFGLAESK